MIRSVPETGSTNADLLADPSAGEGDWLVARRQSAGRGRAGRAWRDGAGNFMGSTVVALRPDDAPAQTLALVTGLAAHSALGDIPGLILKWPNDLLVAGAKLGGVLLERQDERVVVGIGINLAQAPAVADRATVALADLGMEVDVDSFAEALAASFAAVLARWHGGEWPALREAWLARAHPLGTPLVAAGSIGAFAGLGDDGALHLRLADGTVRPIHAGDVEMVGKA
ncbi:MAG TPA: biotin--[acetyl-CoA-carboxylase] ligase [Novosphingobium sp.]|nr:biotin--[acetyl-CoA-carboxylase] ligase [Novosphingobium sp.]